MGFFGKPTVYRRWGGGGGHLKISPFLSRGPPSPPEGAERSEVYVLTGCSQVYGEASTFSEIRAFFHFGHPGKTEFL